jgi:septum formation protein
MNNLQLILASKSPRRQALVAGLSIPFSIELYEVEEDFEPSDLPQEIARKLAVKKAVNYPKKLAENEVLLTADTLVFIDNTVLNKPANEAEAFAMLQQICGKTHAVYTGVCLKSANKETSFSELSLVSCKNLSEDEIWFYIKNYKPMDKAGSYGIQDWFGYTAVEKIEGCYYNIMGLPLSKIYSELKTFTS